MIRLAIRVTLFVSLLVVAYFAVTFVQVWWASTRDDRTPTEAIVVLGAAQYDGRPSAVLEARLEHALELWKDGVADKIVVTGGGQEGDRFTEAWAGANYLLHEGVPDDAILRETGGRSSWESLAASARFLSDRGISSVTLVSDPFHAKRIDAVASEVGLDGRVSPVPDSPVDGAEHWRRLVGETLRVGVGRFVGYRFLDRADDAGDLVPGLGLSWVFVPVGRTRRRRVPPTLAAWNETSIV